LFINTAQGILKAESSAEVMKLLQTLKGDHSVADAQQLSSSKTVTEWTKATAWVEWWTGKRHLSEQRISLNYAMCYFNLR